MNTRKGTRGKAQRNDVSSSELHKTALSSGTSPPSVEDRRDASKDVDVVLDDAPPTTDMDLANLGAEYLDWNNLDIDFADFMDPPVNDKIIAQYPSPTSPSLGHYTTPSTNHTLRVQQAFSLANTSIPPPLSYPSRSLVQRPKLKKGAQRIADLVLYTLKSYLLMLQHPDNPPPFLHPRLLAFHDVENTEMEPLTNCMGLMRMISSDARGSRKLFWRNVRLECERLCQEVCLVCHRSFKRAARS